MNKLRWRAILSGAAAFLLAHNLERVMWTTWFTDAQSMVPWFLNSGRAVAVTLLCVFVAEVLSGLFEPDRHDLVRHAANVSAGAIIALIFALFASGPGTIAPLVIIIGGALVIAAAFAGSLVVRALSARR